MIIVLYFKIVMQSRKVGKRGRPSNKRGEESEE
jgi:hypothetical protein